jgi:dethiobiotin synthetase
MSLDLFITAAGTEIGKTFVAERLIRECAMRGISCDALKPIVTGFDDSAQTDTALLLAALDLPVNEHTVNACSPWRFSEPLSPHMAASRAGRTIALNEVVEFCKQPSEARLRLIEGIGGVMVPINDQETTLDLMATLGISVLLVVGTYLGAISHALTAYEALRTHGLSVQGVVVNESSAQPVPLEETLRTIARFCEPTPTAFLRRENAVDDNGYTVESESLLEALLLLPGQG